MDDEREDILQNYSHECKYYKLRAGVGRIGREDFRRRMNNGYLSNSFHPTRQLKMN